MSAKELAGQQGGTVPEAVVNQVQDQTGLFRSHRISQPISDYQQMTFGQLGHRGRIGAPGSGQAQFGYQGWEVIVNTAVPLTTGLAR